MTTSVRALTGRPEVFEVERRAAPLERETVLGSLAATLAEGAAAHGFSYCRLILWKRAAQGRANSVRLKGFWRIFPEMAGRLPEGCVSSSEAAEEPDGLRFVASALSPISGLKELILAAHGFTRLGAVVLLSADDQDWGRTEDVVAALRDVTSEVAVLRRLQTHGFGGRQVVVIPTGRFDDPTVGYFLLAPTQWEAAGMSVVPSI